MHLRKGIQSFPATRFLYRVAIAILRRLWNFPRRSYRFLQAVVKKKEREHFMQAVAQWDFDRPFEELKQLAARNYAFMEDLANTLIVSERTNPKGYALIQACHEHRPKPSHYDVGVHSRSIGIELVSQGKLKEGVAFFHSLQKIFPDIYEPYALLFSTIYRKQEEYRSGEEGAPCTEKKPLVLSFMVWGDRYLRLFNDCCIPTLLAEGNLPAVATIRDITVDIYAHRQDIVTLKSLDMFASFSSLCDINFIEFPERLITCEEYKKQNASFRYTIYGAFHHLSIERARIMGADVMCLGPDNAYSDGSFFNYVKFVDDGIDAVLFTATRAQAEFILPVMDTMKDPHTKALPISSDAMVDFSAQYIHHSFLQFIVTDEKTPVWRSGFFTPYKHGFYIRSFHYHPVIISSAALARANDIPWNYMTTVDDSLIPVLFPDRNDWHKLKVITDSRDGIMLDIAYGSPGLHHHETTDFNIAYLDKLRNYYTENHFWNFQFTVNYRMDKVMDGVRAYLYESDGSLEPKEFALLPAMEQVHHSIDEWYEQSTNAPLVT